MGPDFADRLLDGRYRVESVLGEGGMGAAYLGTDEKLRRRVVIKVPHARFLAEKGFRERFEKEIRSLTTLEHPQIVKVLDAGQVEQVPYAVLQYLPGGSLKDLIEKRGGKLTPAEVAAWLPSIARALDFVHSKGVVHRDVKPGNILFDEHGNAFLADFGIAKVLGAPDTGLTQTGMTPGSPDYMAPETLTGGTLGNAYDQYGLATVVYEALAGRLPFTDLQNPLEILFRKASGPAEPLIAYDARPFAVAAVMRALSIAPAARFDSCSDFARAFTGSEVPKPPPDGRATRTQIASPEPRSRTATRVAVVAVCTVLGVAALLLARGRGEDPPSERGVSPRPIESDVRTGIEAAGGATPDLDREKILGRLADLAAGEKWREVGLLIGPTGEASRVLSASDLVLYRDGVARYEAVPSLTVETPLPDALVTSGGLDVTGRFERGRSGDRVLVDGREATVDARGRFAARVDLSAEGPMSIAVEVRDGEVARTRRDVAVRVRHPWRSSLDEAGAFANAGDWEKVQAAVEHARTRGMADAALPSQLREGLVRYAAPPVLVIDRPVEGQRLTGKTVVVSGTLATGRRTDVLRIGGVEVPVVEGRFSTEVRFERAGPAAIEATVEDRGTTRWSGPRRTVFVRIETPVPSWARVSREQIDYAADRGIDVAFENELGMRFVLVTPGRIRVPAPMAGKASDASKEKELVVEEPFYLSMTELTNAQFRRFQPSHDSRENLSSPDQPVVRVSFYDLLSFAVWLRAQDPGRFYRLPTSREWAYAVRAGGVRKYSWGDDASAGSRRANLYDLRGKEALNLNGKNDEKRKAFDFDDGHSWSAPVGSFSANALGLQDMDGNVREWTVLRTEDWAGEDAVTRVMMGSDFAMGPEDYVAQDVEHADYAVIRAASVGGRIAVAVDRPARPVVGLTLDQIEADYPFAGPFHARGLKEADEERRQALDALRSSTRSASESTEVVWRLVHVTHALERYEDVRRVVEEEGASLADPRRGPDIRRLAARSSLMAGGAKGVDPSPLWVGIEGGGFDTRWPWVWRLTDAAFVTRWTRGVAPAREALIAAKAPAGLDDGEKRDVEILSARHRLLGKSLPDPLTGVVDGDGRPFRASSYRGRWVLLYPMAPWGPPVREDAPYVREALRRMGTSRLAVIAVALGEDQTTPQHLADFTAEVGIDWQITTDKKWTVMKDVLGVQLFPYSVLLDASGNVVTLGRELTRERLLETLHLAAGLPVGTGAAK